MVNSVSLKPWVSALNQFQKLYLVNKAVLELVGHDVPVIALAKNNDERKERYFRQALVFFFVFLIAPLHARFINHAFSKGVAPPPVLKALAKAGVSSDTLMKLPSTALQSTKALGKGLRTFFNETLGKPMPAVLARAVGEPLRKRMVRAKTAFLMTDLALQGGFFMSIGWLKNLFAKRFLTGSMQFSGERGIVAQNKLDKLYEAQQRRQKLSRVAKAAYTTAIGIAVPALVGLALRRSLLAPVAGKGLVGALRKRAHWFDYNHIGKWPLVSLAPFAIVGYLNDLGDILSSRSKREAIENGIKVSLSTLFIFGDLLWMKGLSAVFKNPDRVPLSCRTFVHRTVDWARQTAKLKRWPVRKAKRFIDRVSSRAAKFYLASFALNTSAVAAIVLFMNHMTRTTLKSDVKKLGETSRPVSQAQYRKPSIRLYNTEAAMVRQPPIQPIGTRTGLQK
ncbi:MAG: hypothetical protein KC474_07580 [Cyanobacteria bacterium HKST-UBA04]|nr:hypothetical protein [Cyanobacteria bacterium HKST-UBA04]